MANVSGLAKKVPEPFNQNQFGLYEKFWAKVYSFDPINKAADSVIAAGAKVEQVKKDVAQGVKLGITFGPTLLIVGAALYFFVISGGLAATVASRRG